MTCHRRIDPWGVAFENYDGIGVWRDSTEGNEPILAKSSETAESALPAETLTPDGDHFFAPQKGIPAPKLGVPADASERALELYKAANESLSSLQRPYNHLRGLGSEGKGDQLRRFLEYIEKREPLVEGAFDKLLKETGEKRRDFVAAFRHDNTDILESNKIILTKSEAVTPAAQAAPVAKTRKSKSSPKSELRGAVDPRTTLANGTDILDFEALKQYILNNKRDEFSETLVRKTMAYAFGRYLDFTDTETVDSIAADFAKHDYRMRHLIESIALSDPFLTK
jgi:hypothetical protein